MAKTVSKIKAELTLDNSKFKKGLKNSGDNTKKFAKGAAAAIAAVAAAMITLGVKASKAYDIQIKAEASLLAALKGRVDVQEELIIQAGILQEQTLFGDEETIKAQAMLAAMGANQQAISTLIPLVQDLATMYGMNLAQAASLVGKSIGSSTNALSRYGIEITGAVGSTERFTSAAEALNKQVGGQAAAAAKVGLGPLIQMTNAWGDLLEKIGETIVENESFIDSMTTLKTVAETWSGSLLKNYDLSSKKLSELAFILNDLQQQQLANVKAIGKESEYLATQISRVISMMQLLNKPEGVIAGKFEPGSIGYINEQLKELNAELIKVTSQDRRIEIIVAIKKLEETKKSFKPETFGDISDDVSIPEVTSKDIYVDLTEQGETLIDVNNRVANSFVGVQSEIERTQWEIESMNESLEMMAEQGISMAARAIGEMIGGTSAEDALAGFIQGIASLLEGFGALLISFGVSLIVLQESMNPYAMIAAGAALIVVGALMASSLGNISSAAGGSGGASGGFGGGQSYSAGSQYDYNREIVLVARGEDLVATIDRQNYRTGVNG